MKKINVQYRIIMEYLLAIGAIVLAIVLAYNVGKMRIEKDKVITYYNELRTDWLFCVDQVEKKEKEITHLNTMVFEQKEVIKEFWEWENSYKNTNPSVYPVFLHKVNQKCIATAYVDINNELYSEWYCDDGTYYGVADITEPKTDSEKE